MICKGMKCTINVIIKYNTTMMNVPFRNAVGIMERVYIDSFVQRNKTDMHKRGLELKLRTDKLKTV